MDLSDINKVGSRKRMNTDAQNLKEKMSRESAKIIKLKVAQDTADELRQRPEVLNQLPATRDLCDALEENTGRVRAALQRAAADRAAPAAVQAAFDQYVAEVERLRLSAEHGAQLTAAADAARRGDEAASEAAHAAASARADEQRARHAELSEPRVASSDAALREMQRTVAEQRAEAERRALDSHAARARADLQAEVEARGAALAGVVARLRDELAAREARAERAAEETARLRAANTNLENVAADLERKLETAGARSQALREEIEGRDREARENAERAEAAREELAASLRDARAELQAEHEAARRELEETRDELTASLRAARAELQAEREARAADAARAEEQQRAAGAAAAEARRALDSRASTVAGLMSDVLGEAKARARLQADLEEELRLKEDELAQQMTIILELRSEKERLQDTIRGMQDTIDNIQQERTREPAEDAAPRGTALDMREVNARFNALARAYPSRARAPRAPAPRAPPPPSPEQRRPQSTAAEDEDTPLLSLSQLRAQLAFHPRSYRNNRLGGKRRKQK